MTQMTTHLPKFVVALRTIGSPWPNTGPMAEDLAKARMDYEGGKVEMAQRREGQTVFQYAIPRKFTAKPRPGYFKPKTP